jgi:hypothetical protein
MVFSLKKEIIWMTMERRVNGNERRCNVYSTTKREGRHP